MTQSDDKPRGKGVREASHLRATLGSEPSSGYAFHDHVRVERVRPGARENAAQPASHAPRERNFARTLVGGITIQDALANRKTEPPAGAPANDQEEASGRVSWPPLPQVPNELEGSVADAEVPTGVRASTPSSAAPAPAQSARSTPSAPPSEGSAASAVPAGGAIWQAMPSLVSTSAAVEAMEARENAPTRETVISKTRNSRPAANRNSRPAGFRPSAAELEAEHAHAYGDQRVLKYEALVERNAWEQLAEELGRELDPSPALLLLRVIAQREVLKNDQKQEAARLAQQGISAMAKILQLPEASPTALVLGKRLLRRNPGWVAKRQASPGLSLGLLLGGIGVGAGIGWLITTFLF